MHTLAEWEQEIPPSNNGILLFPFVYRKYKISILFVIDKSKS